MVPQLSPNLEISMFLAQATGSFIYTDHPFRWSEICSSINYFYGTDQTPWAKIEEYITNLEIELIHFLDQRELVSGQNGFELRYMKNALKKVWEAVQNETLSNQLEIDNLINEIRVAREKMATAIEKIIKLKGNDKPGQKKMLPFTTKGKLSCKIAPTGHGNDAVYRFLLAYAGHEKYIKTLPMALFLEHVK